LRNFTTENVIPEFKLKSSSNRVFGKQAKISKAELDVVNDLTRYTFSRLYVTIPKFSLKMKS
jgi:hypothetical protein